MSKSIRHKPNGAPSGRKNLKRKKPSITSDDSDYSGVDLISDSEEDEPDVEVAEEQAIIESEEEDDFADPQSAMEELENWNGFDALDDDEPDNTFFAEQLPQSDGPDVFTGAADWVADAEETENESQPEAPRRVRFDLADSDSELSDTEENDNDNIFPDIFLDQGSLDPSFRRTIENDHDKDNDDPPSDDGSYWDFNGEDGDMLDEGEDVAINQSDSSCESSGYETDEGETTEEDLPLAARFLPARNVMRRESSASSSSEEDVQLIRRNPYRRTGPRLGSWLTDATKPFAVLDSRGKKLVMFRARMPRRHSVNSSTGMPTPRPYRSDEEADIDLSQMSPMISNSANLMMSAMYTPMDGTDGQALGPPEAFYPFVSVNENGVVTQDSPSSSFDEEDLDDDDLWNIADLVDFGDDSDSDDPTPNEEDEDSSASTTIGVQSTRGRPSTANSEDQSQGLLAHLNSGLVGAFRRNQTQHQLLSRNSASRDSLAFSGRYGNAPIRGIKGGRLAAANTPITPMRKTKVKPIPADAAISPSPADNKKRKFVGETSGHKRIRSFT